MITDLTFPFAESHALRRSWLKLLSHLLVQSVVLLAYLHIDVCWIKSR